MIPRSAIARDGVRIFDLTRYHPIDLARAMDRLQEEAARRGLGVRQFAPNVYAVYPKVEGLPL